MHCCDSSLLRHSFCRFVRCPPWQVCMLSIPLLCRPDVLALSLSIAVTVVFDAIRVVQCSSRPPVVRFAVNVPTSFRCASACVIMPPCILWYNIHVHMCAIGISLCRLLIFIYCSTCALSLAISGLYTYQSASVFGGCPCGSYLLHRAIYPD
jgi:hypothetical protein